MTDAEFVAAVLSGALAPTAFHHRDHLRLAWCLVRQSGVEAASRTIADGIRAFATRHGQAEKYHETLTRCWVRLVHHAIAARPEVATFDQFLAAFPWLLEQDLPYRHWSRAVMQGQEARARWVEPDLRALPA